MNDLKQHPVLKELYVSEDGKIYDINQEKYITIAEDHSCSFDGAIAMWNSCGRQRTLPVAKIIYEAYIGKVSGNYIVKLKDVMKPTVLANLKKVPKYQREEIYSRRENTGDWLNGVDSVYML